VARWLDAPLLGALANEDRAGCVVRRVCGLVRVVQRQQFLAKRRVRQPDAAREAGLLVGDDAAYAAVGDLLVG
jgi:hypothetical protein